MAIGGAGGTEVARFYAILGADTSGFNTGMRQAQSTWGGFSNSILQGVGIGGGFAAITTGIRMVTAAVTDSIQGVMSYETAFTGIRKTVDASDEDFAKLDANIRKIATSGPIGRDALAGIGQVAGQLGIRGTADLTTFIDTIAKVGTATNLSTDAAALGLGRFAAIMGEPISKVDQLASGMVGLGNTMKTSGEAEIMEYASRISGMGKIAGLSSAEVMALGAATAETGMEAEAGGSAIALALNMMMDAVNKGGDDLEMFAAVSGMTSADFKKQWETDAFGAFRSFVEGLNRAGPLATQALDEVGLGGIRTNRALLGLSQNTGQLTFALDTFKTSAQGANALLEENAKFAGTSESATKQFANEVRELSDVIGVGLVNALDKALPLLTRAVQEMRGFLTGTDGVSSAFNNAAGGVYRFLYPEGASNGPPGAIGTYLDGLAGIRSGRPTPGSGSVGSYDYANGGSDSPQTNWFAVLEASARDTEAAANGGNDALKRLIASRNQEKTAMSEAEKAELALARAREAAAEHVEDVMTRRLVEAYITGGDALVQVERGKNEALLKEFESQLEVYKALGLEIPNTAIDMFITIKEAGVAALKELTASLSSARAQLTQQLWANNPGMSAASAASLANVAAQATRQDAINKVAADLAAGKYGTEEGNRRLAAITATITVNAGIGTDPVAIGQATADALNAAARANGGILNAGVVVQ